MKLLLIAFAVIAAVAADVSHLPSNEYLPPAQAAPAPVQAPSNEYLAPVQEAAPVQVEAAPAHELADDGYRYKTQRRVVYRRHRRDASHVPSNDYLPPVQEAPAPVQAPSNDYLPPVQQAAPAPAPIAQPAPAPIEAAPAHVLADDGYRYKTQRRVVYRRHRRDASHVPSNDYLPPVQESAPVHVQANEYASAPVQEAPAPIVQEAPIQVEAAPAHVLADDGYRYKTHRRVVYRRHRRDASHVPSNDYLPPVQEAPAPVQAPSNDYLPPVQQAAPAPAPIALPAPAPVEAAPAHVLADDGYRYKTQRRVVYRRHRRDASHVPSNDYLPPVQESAPVQVQANEYAYAPAQEAPAPVVQEAPIQVEAAPAHVLADDGYRYKTHRRVVYRRHRRDASHVPSNDYLPPVQEAPAPVQAPSNDYLPPVQQAAPAPAPIAQPAPAPIEAAPAHVLADDGYRYKTQRRVVYRRHRRDASHVPSNDYLPPVQEAPAPVQAPSNDYLPPVQQGAPAPAPIAQPAPAPIEAAPAHVLADDGYRYKTQRRVVYRRHRRDASHVPSNDYLPPVQSAPEPVQEYLAPVQEAAPAPVEAAPAHVLADDGYRYKTQRRVVYRRH